MPSPSLRPEPVCVERVVPAPPEGVFDLLSRPERHRDFDGSGTVQGARREGRRAGVSWRTPAVGVRQLMIRLSVIRAVPGGTPQGR